MVSGVAASVAGFSPISAQTGATAPVGAVPSANSRELTGGTLQSTAASPNQQMQNALAALKALSQQRSSTGDAAKGAAMQKLATLKAQLKTLMMLGGDPKQRAKEAAAIARQIAAAAQAYAQAGGDPSTIASASPGDGDASVAASATNGQATDGPPAGDAPQDQVDGSASPSLAAAGADAGVAPPTAPAAGSAPAGGQVAAGRPGESQGSSTTASGSAANGAAAPAKGDGSQMDQAFIQEARNLARQAKAINQAAEQAMKLKHQTSDPTVARAGDAALAAVEAAADQIDASSTAGYDGAVPTPSASAISITA